MVRRSAHGVCRKKPSGRSTPSRRSSAPKRQEVIILDPEHRLRRVEAQQRARHEGVDLAIRGVIVGGDVDEIGPRMQRRPQRRIGEAFVIAAIMLRRHVDGGQRAGAERLDPGERIFAFARRRWLGRWSRPRWRRNPCTIGNSAAASPPATGSSGLCPRDAVGNDDDSLPLCSTSQLRCRFGRLIGRRLDIAVFGAAILWFRILKRCNARRDKRPAQNAFKARQFGSSLAANLRVGTRSASKIAVSRGRGIFRSLNAMHVRGTVTR